MTADPTLLPLAAAVLTRSRTPAQRAYLLRCAGLPIASELPVVGDRSPVDAILDRAWQDRSRADRTALGQVFTPRAVARQVFLELPSSPDAQTRVLDPACGGGIFLAEAADWLGPTLPPACGRARAEALRRRLLGVDVDPVAASLGRLLVGERLVEALGPHDPGDLELPGIVVADATEPATGALIESYAPSHVLGNPPYLEAKRMPSVDRDRLRDRLPELTGAFDAYMAFCHLSLRWVGPSGTVALVLPNKIQVARYAGTLRGRLTAEGRLHALIDLSELPVFARVGVYPIIVVLGPEHGSTSFKASHRCADLDSLGERALSGVAIPHELPRRVMDPPVWFTLADPSLARLADRLLQCSPRLAEIATVRSTCSFHRKGLRERFVRPGEELPEGVPYLGGRSFSRRNEIRPYRVDWTGHRIDFAAETLRELRNPLPPLECFLRPKVIFCQHARTLVAYADVEGRFVTKDVFPIALLHDSSREAVWGLTGILNSRIFSLLYATWFRGIQISGGYLHFLPVYLRRVPVPHPRRWKGLADAVARVQEHPDEQIAQAIDDAVMAAYGLSDADADCVRRLADTELGFAPKLLARR